MVATSRVRRWAAPLAAAVLLGSCVSAEDPGALVPPTVDQDPALPRQVIEVAGHRRAIHLHAFGDPARPVLLMLHGSLCDHRALLPFSALADRYFVVMWDQRGNGLSERVTDAEYTFDSVVDEIAAVKALYSPSAPVTLVGHSFGAAYAALYMSRHPDHVRQAALIEPSGLNGRIFTETFDQIINVDLLDPQMNRTFWQSEALSAADHEQLDYKALQMVLNGHLTNYHCNRDKPSRMPLWRPGAHVEYLRGLRMGGGFDGSRFEFDFAAGLDAFPRKVLLMGSECSALGYDYQLRWHRPLFRDAEVVRIDGAGHRLIVEQFDAVLAALRAYLEEY